MSKNSHQPIILGPIIIFKGEDFIRQPLAEAIDPDKIKQIFFEVSALKNNISKTVRRIEEEINGLCHFKEDRLGYFIIAISEIVQNAMLHGPEDTGRKVGINILYIPHLMLYVGVTDDLGPLPLEKIKLDVVDEEFKLNLSDSKRGCFIARELSSFFICVDGDTKEIILGLRPKK